MDAETDNSDNSDLKNQFENYRKNLMDAETDNTDNNVIAE